MVVKNLYKDVTSQSVFSLSLDLGFIERHLHPKKPFRQNGYSQPVWILILTAQIAHGKADNVLLTYIKDGLKWLDFLKLKQRKEVRNGFRNSSMTSPKF